MNLILFRDYRYIYFHSVCPSSGWCSAFIRCFSVCRVETREEKKERRKREKAEQVAYKLEQVQLFFFANCSESAGESCVICASIYCLHFCTPDIF
jgi:hypothetical protein